MNAYFKREEYDERREYMLHLLKALIMVASTSWLLVSTYRLVKIIRKHSAEKNFMNELRNLALVYWSFVICYILWQGYFVVDIHINKAEVVNPGYVHQLLIMAFPFFLFS